MTALPGDRHLRWDGDGRLVAVCRPVPCGQPGATVLAEYAYDPDGRRVWARAGSDATYYFDGFDLQMPVGGGVGSGTIFRHVRAGDRTIATHQEPEGNLLLAAAAPSEPPILLARIVTGSVVLLVVGLVGVGGPRTRAGRRVGVLRVGTTLVCFLLVQLPVPPGARACEPPTEPLAGTVFYHLDRLGSTELVTDHAGAVEEWLRHDPYGAVSAFQPNGTPKTAPGSTFQFTGQRGDDGTGLYYFGARFYEPALGLFVSPDPAGQFFSPYSYGGGNPLAGTDPTGAEFSLFGLFIIALLSAVATIIDAVVQGASVGDAFKAGAITFGTSLAGAYVGSIVGGTLATLGPAAEAAVFAVGVGSVAYGAYQNFSEGRYASGTLIVGTFVWGVAQGGKGERPAEAPQDRQGDGAIAQTGLGQSQGQQGYKSADDAAIAALDSANPRSIRDNLEYGGWIYERDGSFYYTEPLPGTDQGFSPSSASHLVPKDATIRGVYHTHGDYSVLDPVTGAAIRTSNPKLDSFNSDFFSGQDIRVISSMAQGKSFFRGYLGTPSGAYKVFDPHSGRLPYQIK